MKILNGERENEYVLEFTTPEEFEDFFTQADLNGSFSIPVSNIADGSSFRATTSGAIRSRRIKPVQIQKESASTRIVLQESANAPSAPPSEPEPDPVDEKREPAKTVAEQIRELTVTEKAMLAMKANLAERRVLMQDMNPKIQEFLLRNPQLTEPEIAWLAKNPMSAIPTLLTIIQHKGWMSTDAVRQGILTNPKTPSHIVLDKIPSLSAGDLIKMHHARNLREDVRDAVQRQIKRRGIRIPRISD
ncbi:MAG: hypothetical protein ACRD4B_03870 [Acidobacteriota bacterium]